MSSLSFYLIQEYMKLCYVQYDSQYYNADMATYCQQYGLIHHSLHKRMQMVLQHDNSIIESKCQQSTETAFLPSRHLLQLSALN